MSDGTVSQEAIARGIRIRQTQEGARATMETRVALIVAERGLTAKQLAKFYVSRRKNSKPRFDHWRFAEDQGIPPDWLFEGDLRSYTRGTAPRGIRFVERLDNTGRQYRNAIFSSVKLRLFGHPSFSLRLGSTSTWAQPETAQKAPMSLNSTGRPQRDLAVAAVQAFSARHRAHYAGE